MKNKKTLFILVASVALVVWGLVAMNRRDSSEQSPGQSGTPASEGRTAAPGGLDLLDVGTPASMPSAIKDYTGFRLSFNKDNHTPNWVAWELLGEETEGQHPRSNKFWTDSDIDGCATTDDYRNSGLDRGHLCPAADQKWSPEAMYDCFSLANIAPQDGKLNSGAWNTLEKKERLWAQRDSAIVIIADSPRGIAFVYPNTTAPGNMENYVMTIREVEALTGLDFLKELPDDVEETVETAASFRDWNRRQ